MSAPARTYSEVDAAAVLREAARRHGAPAPLGLTLAEIEEAARAAGVDPALVRAAAADLDLGHPTDDAPRSPRRAPRAAPPVFQGFPPETAGERLRRRAGVAAVVVFVFVGLLVLAASGAENPVWLPEDPSSTRSQLPAPGFWDYLGKMYEPWLLGPRDHFP
ncbi:hypothetical protein RQM47_16180 [Rubrivirga sp. S365]|uniref:hypothetical protein n=1 Tax=Rubrivirga sp. S365 TaxID=3076080 RepID=UPI0028C532BA|nr:hypothetical protein [Rubrivirga sp. S365]MDT7858187.1 hypothetical protein [Rubrivirga sp. S365]